MIHYPITDNGAELSDAGAFIGGMMDKTVTESDCDACEDAAGGKKFLRPETCPASFHFI